MAGFIQCNYGGGGGGPEIIEGTIYGTTSIGAEFTVTSQQGKTPKRAMIWMSEPDTGVTAGSEMFWNADFIPGKYLGMASTNITSASVSASATSGNIGTTSNYCPQIKAVGADNITFKMNGNNAYIRGTFTYHVEFE